MLKWKLFLYLRYYKTYSAFIKRHNLVKLDWISRERLKNSLIYYISSIKGSNKSVVVLIEQDLSCKERDEKDKQWRVAHLLFVSLLSWSALLNV